MYENILVPLDGSKMSEAVLPFIEDILSKLSPDVEKEITLLQVLSDRETIYNAGGEYSETRLILEKKEELQNKAKEYLNRVGETLRGKEASVTPKVVFGIPAEEIVKAADEVGANLIAMSTHDHSGIVHWTFESVTDKVLRHEESVPVLVVRALKKA